MPTAHPSPCLLLLFQLQIAFAPVSSWVSLQDHWCVGVILKLVTGSNQIPCIAVSCSTSLIDSAALSWIIWFGTHKINQVLSYCLGWSVFLSIDSRPFFSFVFFTVECICVNYTNAKIEFLIESDLQEQTWCIVWPWEDLMHCIANQSIRQKCKWHPSQNWSKRFLPLIRQ